MEIGRVHFVLKSRSLQLMSRNIFLLTPEKNHFPAIFVKLHLIKKATSIDISKELILQLMMILYFNHFENTSTFCRIVNDLLIFLLKLQPITLGDGYWKCPFCSKTSSTAQNIKRHIVTHSSVKPFSCNVCGNAFKRKDVLQKHLRRFHPEYC